MVSVLLVDVIVLELKKLLVALLNRSITGVVAVSVFVANQTKSWMTLNQSLLLLTIIGLAPTGYKMFK